MYRDFKKNRKSIKSVSQGAGGRMESKWHRYN